MACSSVDISSLSCIFDVADAARDVKIRENNIRDEYNVKGF